MIERQPYLLLFISFLLALLVWLLPVRGELAFWRPPMLLLLTIYWLFREIRYIGVMFAWFLGLFVDLMFGQVLGQHALAMSLAVYLVITQRQRLGHFSLPFQCLFVGAVVLVYQIVLLSVRLAATDFAGSSPLLYPVLASVALWPLLWLGLHKLQRFVF